MDQYQLLPDLTSDEYEALKADIAARGVQVPVERDETGAVLDGHHRIRACEELGITDYPTIIRTGMDEDQKREHVLALNLDRRHLTQQQKRELVAKLLVATPEVSNRQIAETAKVDDHTVAGVRRGLQATAEIPQLDRTVGADGKARPAHKPTAVITTTPKQTEAALTILQTSGTEPPKAMSTVADLKQAARYDGAAQREADVKAKADAFDGTDLLTLLHGDFREQTASIADGSVDLVFTDPPYGEDYLSLWDGLGEVAARVLKPGGLLLAFVGKTHLPQCLSSLAEHLRYYWLCDVGYENAKRTVWGVRFWGQHRPILVMSNGEPLQHRYANDLLYLEQDKRPDQSLHPWAQADDAATYYIDRLSDPGETVLDPMCGTGTFVRAAAALKRRAVGIEADAERYKVCAGLCVEVVCG